MSIVCQYCGSELQSKSSLTLHQQTAKYCLSKQNVQPSVEASVSKNIYECQYCNELFSRKSTLSTHSTRCKIKKEMDENKMKSLSDQILMMDFKHQIDVLQKENKRLTDELELLKKQKHEDDTQLKNEMLKSLTLKQSNLNDSTGSNKSIPPPNAKTVNNLINFDVTEDIVSTLITGRLTESDIIKGPIGVIDRLDKEGFFSKNLYRKVMISDESRGIIAYKLNGCIYRDGDVSILNMIQKGSITEVEKIKKRLGDEVNKEINEEIEKKLNDLDKDDDRDRINKNSAKERSDKMNKRNNKKRDEDDDEPDTYEQVCKGVVTIRDMVTRPGTRTTALNSVIAILKVTQPV